MNELIEDLKPEFRPLIKEFKFKKGAYNTV
jgi:hypothetical protein